MLTVGIDSIEIDRFISFTHYSRVALSRLYSTEEIDYCLKEPCKAAERLAVRFAVKEAFFKALAPRLEKSIPFLTVCKSCHVLSGPTGTPRLEAATDALGLKNPINTEVSLTHTSTTATAIVIITNLLSA